MAVVDGSNSPSTSERLGNRFGAYTAGYLLFQGIELVDEGYRSGCFSQEQVGDQDVAQKILNMLRFKLERDVALYCLNELKADLVLLDGSFFGFRAQAHLINSESIDIDGYRTGLALTLEVRDRSLKLLNSGKTAAVIKRTRTTAIDGWIFRRFGEDHCVNTNDKHIMSHILPPGHWFAYEWILDHPSSYNYYTRLRQTYHFLKSRKKPVGDMGDVYKTAQSTIARGLWKSLRSTPERIFQTSRYFARCCAMAPFEFETPIGYDVASILAYFSAFHNAATGLPWPLDLVDAAISLTEGFTKEFVDEVEATLLKDPELRDKSAILQHFSYLNPQKEEG